MNIMQFIDEYEASANKKNYVEKHITKRYLPFETKVALAEQIIKNTMYITVMDKKLFRPNTPSKHMWTTIIAIKNYTDIELEDATDTEISVGQQNLNSFNLLEKCGATLEITKAIGIDFAKFANIIEMVLQDTLDAERNIVPFLDTKIDAWRLSLEVLGSTIQEIQERQNND